VTVVLTWYGFNDNSGQTEQQHGSAKLAHPKKADHRTLHNLATEGSGTFKDPITFAARGNDEQTFPIGSVIYVPLTQKYYIMEDTCGDTDAQGCAKGTHHVDLWMGPQRASNGRALGNCQNSNTPKHDVQVIINPRSTLPVNTTPQFKNNRCTLRTFQ
jgi:3D (Asp-Asp-Asp) domain-containing protein